MLTRLAALAATTLVSALLLAVPVSPASAAAPDGTVVFIRSGNVFLMRADGSGLHQVTTDGTVDAAYGSPTMSDSGVIAAAKGDFIYVMQQNGVVITKVDPPGLTNSVSHPVDGFVNYSAISPDGSKLAYGFTQWTCPIGVSCGARSVSAVIPVTGGVATMKSYQRHPSWVSNSRVMAHGGYGSHVTFSDASGSDQVWFNDGDLMASGTDLGDASLSADGTRLVAIRGYGDSTEMIWYSVTGDPRSAPVASLPDPRPLCQGGTGATATDEKLHNPTWSPDGTAFAIGSSEGIYVVTAPTAVGTCASTHDVLLGAGTEPSFSPAAINPPPTPSGPGTPGAPGGPGAPGEGSKTLTMKVRPKVTGQAKVGRTLRASKGSWNPSPTKFTFRWLRNGKVVKGAKKATYRLTKRDRGTKISVKLTVSRSGFVSTSVKSKAVRVRR